MNTAQMHLETTEAGKYRYKITRLSDAAYDDVKNLPNPIIFDQYVLALPTATWAESSEPFLYCGDTSFEDPRKNGIPMILTGTPPFDLQVQMYHELQRVYETISLNNIRENRYYFVPPRHTLSRGVHTLEVTFIKDANGCETKPAQSIKTSFTVADEASISPVEPQQHHCIGDRISYSLQGTSPWEIEYEFEGKRMLAKTTNPTFSRVAERMGTLSIISVADRASSCKASIEPGKMVKEIHEVPSVRIEGNNIIENIREGIYSHQL
jgi:nucleoporin POM152